MPQRLVPPTLLERLGRRGAFLALIGFVWMLQAVALGLTRVGGIPHSPFPHENLPFPVLSLFWAISGVTAASVGFRHTPRDHAGFVAASAPPLLSTGSYLVGGLTWLLTLGDRGDLLGFVLTFGWGSIAVLIGIVASWPEPVVEVIEEKGADG